MKSVRALKGSEANLQRYVLSRISGATGLASLAVLAILPLHGSTKTETENSKPGEAIVLPRFMVLSDFLTITFSGRMSGWIASGEVTWVAKDSPADKRDIEVNDQLLSVDGMEIAGKKYDEVHDLIERELKPGESRRLRFSGRRGLLGRKEYVFVIERPALTP
jgi:hypothetical protein